MNEYINKAIKIAFYVIGVILVIVSLVEYSNRLTRGINASASVIEAVYWLIAGCTSLIMGHLTALIGRKLPENKNRQESSNELNQKGNENN